MSEQLRVRLSRLWDVGDRDIPTIAEATSSAMTKVNEALDSHLEGAFTNVEALGDQFQTTIDWFRVALSVTTSRLGHAANAVKAVVADYATTEIALSDGLNRELDEYLEQRPEHAP